MNNKKELKIECSECSRRKFYQKGYEDCRREMIQKIMEKLEEELKLADEEKRRCVNENALQFDSAKGYATGVYNSIEIVKEVVGGN